MQKEAKVYQSLEIEVCRIDKLYNNAPANYESWSVDDKAAAERVETKLFQRSCTQSNGILKALNFSKSV